MARMDKELFHFLVSRNIFKNYYRSEKASEKTEQRRVERNRGILVWLASGQRTDPATGLKRQIGKGTYIRSLHGRLKHDR
jgi:hypothetical protein